MSASTRAEGCLSPRLTLAMLPELWYTQPLGDKTTRLPEAEEEVHTSDGG
jgi:hypothetical protein